MSRYFSNQFIVAAQYSTLLYAGGFGPVFRCSARKSVSLPIRIPPALAATELAMTAFRNGKEQEIFGITF
jgi:hypothetical protein